MKQSSYDIDLLRKKWQEKDVLSHGWDKKNCDIDIRQIANAKSSYERMYMRIYAGVYGSIALMLFVACWIATYMADIRYAILYFIVLLVTIVRVWIAFRMFFTIRKMNPIKYSLGQVAKATAVFSAQHQWNHIYTFYIKIPLTLIAIPPLLFVAFGVDFFDAFENSNVWIIWVLVAVLSTVINIFTTRYFFKKQKERIKELMSE